MMDFKGTWRTRSNEMAYIRLFELNSHGNGWVGCFEEGGEPHYWDSLGNSLDRPNDWDLMERLSERWSKERSGGE